MIALTLGLVICALAPAAYSENINVAVDKMLNGINDEIARSGMGGPLRLPHLDGLWSAVQSDIVVYGLNTIYRTGDCERTKNQYGDTFALNLGLRSMVLSFGKLELNNTLTSGVVNIAHNSFRAEASIQRVGEYCQVILGEYGFTLLDAVKLITPEDEIDVSEQFNGDVRRAVNALIAQYKVIAEQMIMSIACFPISREQPPLQLDREMTA